VIVVLPRLLRIAAALRRDGKTIAFTNGCFDIIHPGHLRVLAAAKRLGDVLVVGLNTDASIRRLKGPSRPVNPQRDRALVLDALKPVDYVVLFGEDTPLRLITALKPDVVVKGGDYAVRDIVGYGIARRVVRVPLLPGRSTTRTVERLRRR